MYIKCWGSRGSISVSGKEYIKYGGDTTCLEIRPKSGEIIILDAGTGIRRLGNKMIEEKRFMYHFIFTHAHWDHLMGFPFFKPIYNPKCEFQMRRGPFSNYVEKMLSRVMDPPNFPISYSDLRAKIIYVEHGRIGSIKVESIPISHPNSGSGYKFIEEGKSFVFLTDNELDYLHPKGVQYNDYLQFCRDVDILFHDAEYTSEEYKIKKTWGHTSYMRALQLAMEAGVKEFGLFHLNQERTDTQMDQIIAHCHRIIAKKGSLLKCYGVATDMVINL